MTIFAARSERFEQWVAPLAERGTPWRIVLGVLLAGAVWLLVLVGATMAARAAGLAPGRGLILVFLISFAGLIAGAGLAMRLLHRLPGVVLLGAAGQIEPGRVLGGAGVVAAILAVGLVPMLFAGPLERQHDFASWAMWLPVMLPALFLQVAGEEILFRGYLQVVLAARFRSRWIWWFLPALGFGALHWNPAEFEGGNAWLVVAAAVLMGLVFGDVTARTGSLSAAIGLHFANNAFAMLVVATPSALSGFALYLAPIDVSDALAVRVGLIGNIVLVTVAYAGYLGIVTWRERRRVR